MYEIIVVAATLTTIFIFGLFARRQTREEPPEEIPDGGENIAVPSQSSSLSTDSNINQQHNLETSEPVRLTEYIQEPMTAENMQEQSSAEPTIEIEIENAQEPAPFTAEPTAALELPITTKLTQLVVKPFEQIAISEEVKTPVLAPEPVIQEAKSDFTHVPVDVATPLEISTVTEFDDPRLKVMEILSMGSTPKTVREIAQAYYGKGAYNKRKDSRIRRILAEMTQEGLLIETSIASSRAFEIKKIT